MSRHSWILCVFKEPNNFQIRLHFGLKVHFLNTVNLSAMSTVSHTTQYSLHSCPSRVEGERLLQRPEVQWWLQPPPKWTTCMELKPGGAGSNNETNTWQRVSFSSLYYSTLILGYLFPWPTDCSHCYIFYGLVHPVDIKEDVLQCDSAELSFALSHFIREVRRPNGETYSPDSIFYLCLGIQQVHTLVVSLVSILIHLVSFLLIPSFLSPSLWTVPVHEEPHREHLYWRAVQSVCYRDHQDAATLET